MEIDNKKIDELYDKFCNWYEDDGSHDEQIKVNIKSEIEAMFQEKASQAIVIFNNQNGLCVCGTKLNQWRVKKGKALCFNCI